MGGEVFGFLKKILLSARLLFLNLSNRALLQREAFAYHLRKIIVVVRLLG
jgi:hypothetical protein